MANMASLRIEIQDNWEKTQTSVLAPHTWYYAAATLKILYFIVKLEENNTTTTTTRTVYTTTEQWQEIKIK